MASYTTMLRQLTPCIVRLYSLVSAWKERICLVCCCKSIPFRTMLRPFQSYYSFLDKACPPRPPRAACVHLLVFLLQFYSLVLLKYVTVLSTLYAFLLCPALKLDGRNGSASRRRTRAPGLREGEGSVVMVQHKGGSRAFSFAEDCLIHRS